MNVDGVVPLAVEVVRGEWQRREFTVADLDAFGIPARVIVRLDGETRRGGGRRDQFDDGTKTGQ